MADLSRRELLKRYQYVSDFFEGSAVAWSKETGKAFHVRGDGTRMYEQEYDWVDTFWGGLARVCHQEVKFYIRPDGSRL